MNTHIQLYPVWIRIWHWTNALLFLALTFSGMSMRFAGSGAIPWIPFNTARLLHNSCGILLAVGYVAWFVGNILSGNWRHYVPELKGLIGRLIEQTRFYAVGIFQDAHHPFPATARSKFNPLQQLTYLGVMFVAMPVLIVTGILFFFPEYAPESFLGFDGLWPLAILHYITGLFLMIFLIGHIYLATAGETVIGEFKKMVFGSTIQPEEK
ncbi:MAG: cytochrome b/b6 domain-containing protein [Magnetococcales bacterium]|nr:cytochrome b/b6 domain-containing protein [Magnetococcales bacterium]